MSKGRLQKMGLEQKIIHQRIISRDAQGLFHGAKAIEHISEAYATITPIKYVKD
jgi:hypothetical protein